MGATNFAIEATGTDPVALFEELANDARDEYGYDGYNGTISTCCFGRITKRFEKYSKTNEKKAYEFVEKESYGTKRNADVVDMGVVEWRVTTIKKKTYSDQKPVYRMKYVALESTGVFQEPNELKAFDTKKEADDYVLKIAIKHPNRSYRVEYSSVLISGSPTVTRFEKEVKAYKSKPNLKPMANRIVEPVHKYLFYGWAAM